ncbi:MAG: polyprenyl diphosphate synthase, partial [Weeksellaceae bacterium]|nr:polyprenyl diphosphate synthase [Weeksellaceae bacterium]
MNQSLTNTQINSENLPQHVAIIMDGNGRWAKERGFARTVGHQNGIESVRTAIEVCGDLKIPYLTLFAFSTENWNRPKMEVDFLMKLLSQTIQSEIKELHEKNIRLKVIGDL